MANKQRKYWQGLIDYIRASQDVIDDLLNCDGDEDGAEALRQERLNNLMGKYILREKPFQIVFLGQKKRVSALPIEKETKP